jgi:hypothetical protein
MSRPTIVAFWINAFIPRDIFGLTKEISGGTYAGKTAIDGPLPISDCFLTDQRSFDTSRNAKSRMHSEGVLYIDGDNLMLNQAHRCDDTIEVDCEDGDEECKDRASTSKMSLSLVSSTTVDEKARILVNMAASNPCFFGSPDIDVVGEIVVDFAAEQVIFTGKVEPFPAFEAYTIVDSGSIQSLLQLLPLAGSSPSDLFGPPNRAFSVSVPFT